MCTKLPERKIQVHEATNRRPGSDGVGVRRPRRGPGLGLGAGAAQADLGPAYGPHHWCPGDNDSTAPTTAYNWDFNICHTYYWVDMDKGNVPYRGRLPSNLWDGDNPPGEVTQPRPCPPSILPCL
jgi:hypothetical protein